MAFVNDDINGILAVVAASPSIAVAPAGSPQLASRDPATIQGWVSNGIGPLLYWDVQGSVVGPQGAGHWQS